MVIIFCNKVQKKLKKAKQNKCLFIVIGQLSYCQLSMTSLDSAIILDWIGYVI